MLQTARDLPSLPAILRRGLGSPGGSPATWFWRGLLKHPDFSMAESSRENRTFSGRTRFLHQTRQFGASARFVGMPIWMPQKNVALLLRSNLERPLRVVVLLSLSLLFSPGAQLFNLRNIQPVQEDASAVVDSSRKALR
ncbi:hypothetical protein VTI28DRAFT_2024 [Corynascus sepedonium]